MKVYQRIRVEKSAKRQLQQVEMPATFHRNAKDYSKTFDNAPEFVLLVSAENELYHTSAANVSELSSLIKCVDVKYVYETDTQSFYKVV